MKNCPARSNCTTSFGYSKLEKPLIEGFSFKLQSGKSIAFVGASGSGKSTVSKIISGLYMPWGGDITVDGDSLQHPIRNTDQLHFNSCKYRCSPARYTTT